MNRLFLLRHGENQANLTTEFSCWKIDYPLNEKGRQQAWQAGLALLEKISRSFILLPSNARWKPLRSLDNADRL